ncbi:transmembrane protein 220 [Caerostris extrusa]|uniref:Transmembrane protein 220 n=1 Tax=Caerostris extrusa TaxID=172846 RepID=A0AAV4YD23_CAEEX|nr:transmembrane protein 220 [Caerostris extrusa]
MEVKELKEPLKECKDFGADEEIQDHVFVKKTEKQKSAESAGKIIWRGANAMMTIFFFNDPDPYLWVPLYGTAAALTTLVTVRPSLSENQIWRCIYWIHAAFCTAMFVYVLVQLVMVSTNPQTDGSLNPLTYEEGREMAGVMITAVWLFICKQSPTIRCTFPRWCPCNKARPTHQRISDVVFLEGQTALLYTASLA